MSHAFITQGVLEQLVNSFNETSLKLQLQQGILLFLKHDRQYTRKAIALTLFSMDLQPKMCWNSSLTASLKLLERSAIATKNISFFNAK